MIKLLTNAQMRSSDEYTIKNLGVHSKELMHRAGAALADEVVNVLNNKKLNSVTIICGNGNNGGDGYVCAQILQNGGKNVKVYAKDGKLSPDCQREKEWYSGEYTSTLDGDILVDCIFGTGLSRNVEGEYKQLIENINASGKYIISCDIPSGLNGDNGQVLGVAVRANLTVAIAQYKVGMLLNDGVDYCGKIVKKDIGIQAQDVCAYVYENQDVSTFYPARRRNTNKGSYGSANIIAGSKIYMGAPALSIQGALMSGCGYVKLSCPDEVKNALVAAYPQVIYLNSLDLTCQSIAIGMGCGKSKELYDAINFLLKNYEGKLVIDADGLNVLAEQGTQILQDKKCQVLITPHIKEFSRLTKLPIEKIVQDPISAARNFAIEHNITVLLKSATSIITDGKNVVLNTRGTTALSKGGSGDILSGVICGNAARGLNLFDAAVASSYVLGKSAEICSQQKTDYCVTAKDLIKCLPNAVKSLTSDI